MRIRINLHNITRRGRDSSVGIATRYGLDGPGIESRWRARFSASVQTGPEAHPASYTMGTGSFPRVKRPGRGVDHPHPSSDEVEGRVQLYIYSPSGPSWPVLGRALPLNKQVCLHNGDAVLCVTTTLLLLLLLSSSSYHRRYHHIINVTVFSRTLRSKNDAQ